MKLLLAFAEAKEGSTNTKQLVRYIGNKCLKLVEISAQGVVYATSNANGITKCSINTSPPAERMELLKH